MIHTQGLSIVAIVIWVHAAVVWLLGHGLDVVVLLKTMMGLEMRMVILLLLKP